MRQNRAVAIAIALLIALASLPANAQMIEFEHPYTPEQYVEQKIKGRIGPEIKTFVSALAAILVVKSIFGR